VLISIVLPVYNVGKYIERSLLSCMGQTCSGIEIIVVDDCGHDDSIEQAERLAQKDQRIKIVRNKENMGTYHARRIGVENSTGEYILFLDPDDELRLEAVDKISAAALGGGGFNILRRTKLSAEKSVAKHSGYSVSFERS